MTCAYCSRPIRHRLNRRLAYCTRACRAAAQVIRIILGDQKRRAA